MSAPAWTPEALDALFDRAVDLILEWHDCEQWADNCPASERDDARGKAAEAKDEVLQFLSVVITQ